MKLLRLLLILTALVCVSASAQGTASRPASKTAPSAKTAGKAPSAEPLIDINRASAVELKTLPGIGDAYSAAIIKNRPYKNKTQLESKGVVPQATYGKIKDKIIAKQ